MKNNELLKKYAGISTRIRRIFAYHYDQIQRESNHKETEILHQLEISNLLEQLKNN